MSEISDTCIKYMIERAITCQKNNKLIERLQKEIDIMIEKVLIDILQEQSQDDQKNTIKKDILERSLRKLNFNDTSIGNKNILEEKE